MKLDIEAISFRCGSVGKRYSAEDEYGYNKPFIAVTDRTPAVTEVMIIEISF
jgi:hypothetical protein